MAKASGEVVPTPGEEYPFKVVLSYGDMKVETPVPSVEEGERLIVETLQGLHALAEREGYV